MLKSIYDYDFHGKRVLVRVDFNVPLDANGQIADDTRIIETLPTIDKIIDDGGIPILISHLGRPKGKYNSKFSLKPVADYFSNYLGYKVIFAEDCIGEPAKKAVAEALPGWVVLLENLRFHPEEEENSIEFAKHLRELADAYVNDAFASCHRAHASVSSVAKLFDLRFAGKLLLNEIHYLGNALAKPTRPFVAIIGGAKIAGKIDIIQNLFESCDSILIGGGLTYTFLRAMNYSIGDSIVEEDKISLAKQLIEEASKRGVELIVPIDVMVADKISPDANVNIVSVDSIPMGWLGVDIGPNTQQLYSEKITSSKTIVWNGPVGIFEIEKFSEGTKAIASAMVNATTKGAITIVGGGDSASAISKLGYQGKVSHVSTGGGASLDFLGGKEMPGIVALEV
ncbi:MAG: phosphoglycerate kinase [Candidatus Kapaibacteriales bacterium]